MIKLSEKAEFVSCKFFNANSLAKRGESIYYVSETFEDFSARCVKMNRDGISFVKVVTELIPIDKSESIEPFDNWDREDILEEMVENIPENEKREMLDRMFKYLSYSQSEEDVYFEEEILEFFQDLKVEPDMINVEKNLLSIEFFHLFSLEGEIETGYYEGGLMLRNVRLINRSTGQVVKKFDDIQLESDFYLDEEDDEETLLEAYLESLSEEDAKEAFGEFELFV